MTSDKIGQWYVVQVMSGKERKAKENIERSLELEHMTEYVHEILVPSESISDVKAGKKRVMNRKFFPGYVLAYLDLKDSSGRIREDVWYYIRNINGVINFLGGKRPEPLTQREVDDIMQQLEVEGNAVKPRIEFEINETVKINEGPFENFEGVIQSIDPDRGKLHVDVTIFGRSTPVELEYWQVERV